MSDSFTAPIPCRPESYSIGSDSGEQYWRAHALGIKAAALACSQTLADKESAIGSLTEFMLGQESQRSQLEADKERLIRLSNTDPLTGLYNRRGAEHAYQRLSGSNPAEERRTQSHGPVSAQVLILDLDDFKIVNEEHGHHAGDDLLVKVGHLMSNQVRSNDILARWGGDEFVILLPRTPKNRAVIIASEIQSEISSQTGTTVSIGVGEVDYVRSLEETVNLADGALLQAKQGGKNVVVHFDDLVIDLSKTKKVSCQ